MGEWPSMGILLSVLGAHLREKGRATFAEQYGAAFFVRHHAEMRLDGPSPTRVDTSLHEVTGELVPYVHPVRRQPDSLHPFVSIGRLQGNDVAFRDETVSKFHA